MRLNVVADYPDVSVVQKTKWFVQIFATARCKYFLLQSATLRLDPWYLQGIPHKYMF